MSVTSRVEDLPYSIDELDKHHLHESPASWVKIKIEFPLEPLMFYSEQSNTIYKVVAKKVLFEYNPYYIDRITESRIDKLSQQPKPLRPLVCKLGKRTFTAPHIRVTPLERIPHYIMPVPKSDTSVYEDAFDDTNKGNTLWREGDHLLSFVELSEQLKTRVVHFRPSAAYSKNIVKPPQKTSSFKTWITKLISFVKNI